MWLLLPFVILPIIEIALFIQIGGLIGVLPVIGLVLASAVLGVGVMQRQGGRAMLDVQQAMQDFRDPGRPMAHGALIMIGGVLMVLPGLFTSAVGILLLIPFVRTLILRRMAGRVTTLSGGMSGGMSGATFGRRAGARHDESEYGMDPAGYRPTGRGRDGDVIDGEYSVQDDPPAPIRDRLTDADDGSGTQSDSRRGNSGWTRH